MPSEAKEACADSNLHKAQIAHEGYAPCPTCKQYSHSLGDDALADAVEEARRDHLALLKDPNV